MNNEAPLLAGFAGFDGVDAPNTTQVPNMFFDLLAPTLSEAELRVLLYIIRRTFGFRKSEDSISLRQMVDGIVRRDGRVLDRGTGLSKSGVTKALRGLLDKGVIIHNHHQSAEKGNEPTTYALRFKDPLSTEEDKGVSSAMDTPLSTGVDTQKKGLQNQDKQSNSSNDERGEEFEDANGIKLESSASEAVIPPQVRAEIPPPPTNEPEASRHRSEVTPISQVLQARVAAMGQSSTGPPVEQSSLLTSAPPSKSPVGPSLGPGSGTAAAVGQEGAVPLKEAGGSAGGSEGRSRRRVQPSLQIEAIVTQFSHEFHDVEHLQSNINQAARLWEASGRSEQTFCQLLFDAASSTRKRGGLRNRMAYYFRVLRDLLGLTQQSSL